MLTSDIDWFQSKGFFLIRNKCCLISHSWHWFNRIHRIRTIRSPHYKNRNLVTKALGILYRTKRKKSLWKMERDPLVPNSSKTKNKQTTNSLLVTKKCLQSRALEEHRVKPLRESELAINHEPMLRRCYNHAQITEYEMLTWYVIILIHIILCRLFWQHNPSLRQGRGIIKDTAIIITNKFIIWNRE